MKVLLDNCMPKPWGRRLVGHEVRHASTMGWSRLVNGELLAAAVGGGFEVLITTDRSIPYQQNEPPIPIVVIDSLFNTDKSLMAYVPQFSACSTSR